jgi:hypothetical protein
MLHDPVQFRLDMINQFVQVNGLGGGWGPLGMPSGLGLFLSIAAYLIAVGAWWTAARQGRGPAFTYRSSSLPSGSL